MPHIMIAANPNPKSLVFVVFGVASLCFFFEFSYQNLSWRERRASSLDPPQEEIPRLFEQAVGLFFFSSSCSERFANLQRIIFFFCKRREKVRLRFSPESKREEESKRKFFCPTNQIRNLNVPQEGFGQKVTRRKMWRSRKLVYAVK